MVRIEFSVRHVMLLLLLGLSVVLAFLLRDVVVLLGIAVMLTAALNPLVSLVERRGGSHSWGVAAVMLGLVLLPLVVLAALSPLIIGEVRSLAQNVPALQTHADALLRHFGLANRVNAAINKANPGERLGGLAVVSAQQSVSLLVQVVTVVVITGYLLSDGPHLKGVLHDFVPQVSERHIEPLLQGMERVVGGYIRGQMMTSAMFGLFAFVLCLLLRVPSPLLLGIVAGVGDVIPLFGVPAAMLIAVLVAFTHSTWQAIAVLTGYLIYSQLESHFILPRVYARTVNLSPLMVILATIAGGALDGVTGILLGIPLVGVLKVIFDYVVTERRHGHEEAAAAMAHEATDIVVAETGETLEPLEADPVPSPTTSPFEPIPDSESDSDSEDALLQTASARILRLEEQVAQLSERIGSSPESPAKSEHLELVP